MKNNLKPVRLDSMSAVFFVGQERHVASCFWEDNNYVVRIWSETEGEIYKDGTTIRQHNWVIRLIVNFMESAYLARDSKRSGSAGKQP